MAPISGPQLPPSFSGPQLPSSTTIGPSFPPPSTTTTTKNDSDSEDDYGPSLPPEFQRPAPVAGPSLPFNNKVVQGPTMPSNYFPSPSTSSSSRPIISNKKKETPLSNTYSDDESEDDFGPMPLPSGYEIKEESEGVKSFREREEREIEKKRKELEGKGKPKREEWMLVPPKDVDLMSSKFLPSFLLSFHISFLLTDDSFDFWFKKTVLSSDTTKLKSRTFTQSGSTPQSTRKDPNAVNLWTETPQERQERLQDELLGRKGKAEISAAGGGRKVEEGDDERRKRERDWVLREEVERHNVGLSRFFSYFLSLV